MEIKTEIWKPIKDYEGIYEISSIGRVKRLERDIIQPNPNPTCTGICIQHIEERILSLQKQSNGYLTVHLRGSKDGKRKIFLVHRLVAIAFIDNNGNLPQVNHKNEIRDDNRVENLEWCDSMYNMHYGNCQKKIYEGQHFKPVDVYSKNGIFINHYRSISDASKDTGVRTGLISQICHGKILNGVRRVSALGFRFKFADI